MPTRFTPLKQNYISIPGPPINPWRLPCASGKTHNLGVWYRDQKARNPTSWSIHSSFCLILRRSIRFRFVNFVMFSTMKCNTTTFEYPQTRAQVNQPVSCGLCGEPVHLLKMSPYCNAHINIPFVSLYTFIK